MGADSVSAPPAWLTSPAAMDFIEIMYTLNNIYLQESKQFGSNNKEDLLHGIRKPEISHDVDGLLDTGGLV